MRDHSELTGRIIACAMKVHSVLGPGLLESAYRACLIYELNRNGLKTKSELPVPIIYDTERLELGYRLDVLVEGTVVVEVKSIEMLAPIHKAQLISHIKLGGFPTGLLINFNVLHLRDGIKRVYPHASAQPSPPQEEESET